MARYHIQPNDATKRAFTLEADEARVEADTNAVIFFLNPGGTNEEVVGRLLNVSFRKLRS